MSSPVVSPNSLEMLYRVPVYYHDGYKHIRHAGHPIVEQIREKLVEFEDEDINFCLNTLMEYVSGIDFNEGFEYNGGKNSKYVFHLLTCMLEIYDARHDTEPTGRLPKVFHVCPFQEN